MSIYKELNRNPTRRDLLSFGLVFAGGMGDFFSLSLARGV